MLDRDPLYQDWIDASRSETENMPLPIMSDRERADLEREAGHSFSSNEEAHRYRIHKLNVVTSSADLRERIEKCKNA